MTSDQSKKSRGRKQNTGLDVATLDALVIDGLSGTPPTMPRVPVHHKASMEKRGLLTVEGYGLNRRYRLTRKALIAHADRNQKPEPHGEERSEIEAPFWAVCRFGNEGRLRRALDDAWAAAGGRPLVWSHECYEYQPKSPERDTKENLPDNKTTGVTLTERRDHLPFSQHEIDDLMERIDLVEQTLRGLAEAGHTEGEKALHELIHTIERERRWAATINVLQKKISSLQERGLELVNALDAWWKKAKSAEDPRVVKALEALLPLVSA